MREFVFPHKCRKFVLLVGLPLGELCVGERLWGMAQSWGTRRFRGRLRRRGVCAVQRSGRFGIATTWGVDGRRMYANFDLTPRSQRGSEQCGCVVLVVMMRYVIVQEAPEIVERASEMFVRLSHGGRLMLHGGGLLWGVRLRCLGRRCVRCRSRAGSKVE
jgi:hypothetical protein